MCLAFSLVTFTPSEDAGARQTAVIPTTLLPQPARMIGGASTLKWVIGDNCLGTYLVRVVHQADDIAALHRAEPRWNAGHPVLVSVDEGVRQAEAPGMKILRRTIFDNRADSPDSAVPSANATEAAAPDANHVDALGTEAVSRNSSQQRRSEGFVEKMFLFLAQQAPEDILVFLRNLVLVLKSQGHIAKQCEDFFAVCGTLITKVCAQQDVTYLRCENLMQLDDLPDEMLVKIFSFLPPDDLLRSVRPVNRRCRRLALDSKVWQHCAYLLRNVDFRSLRLALRLAPCLQTLELDPNHHPTELDPDDTFHLEEDVKSVKRLMGSGTKCAIAKVHLNMTGCLDAGWAAAMLKRQVSLGRLRFVYIKFQRDDIVPQSDVSRILSVLESCDLFGVGFGNYSSGPLQPPDFQPLPEGQRLWKELPFSSLLDGELEPLLEHLLKLHGPGLEVVDLRGYALGVALLPQYCSSLKEASLPINCNLEPLRQCSGLTSLHLNVNDDPSRGALAYLRCATGLTSVFVELEELRYFPCMETLVEALASSGESLLERLEIGVSVLVEALIEVEVLPLPLAGLPRLELLMTAFLPGEGFLDSITPTSAPNLRMLHFSRETCCYGSYFCILSDVRRLLRRNPLLHVTGPLASHRCTAWGRCACCRKGAHSGAGSEEDEGPSGFYAHDASHRCGLHHSSLNWVRMDCRGRNDSSSSEGDETDQDEEAEELDVVVEVEGEEEECTSSENDELEDEDEEVEDENEEVGEGDCKENETSKGGD